MSRPHGESVEPTDMTLGQALHVSAVAAMAISGAIASRAADSVGATSPWAALPLRGVSKYCGVAANVLAGVRTYE